MEKIKTLKIQRFAFLPAIFLVFVLLFTTHVFAASTSTKTPGEIIDATCSKEDVNCILTTSIKIKITRIGESLSNTSDSLSSGWNIFTNELIDNSIDSLNNNKNLVITLGQTSHSTSSALSSGWSTFTNQLIDNSINTLSAHKQFADNLENNLTKGTRAYTNTILNIPDQAVRAFSGTKDLGLATTASVGDSLLGASNGISDGWVSFTNTIINNTKQSLTNTKDLAVSIWNNITSIPETLKNGAETFIATLNGPAPTIPQVTLPKSLVTTSPRLDLGENPTLPVSTPSVPLSGETNPTPKVVTPVRSITNITQQQRDVYINQYDPSILPRIQGIELALQNSISHNTNQTDRTYDSVINSITSASDNITEEGILNKTTLRTPRISDGTLSGTTIIGLVEAPGTLTVNDITTLNNNTEISGSNTFKVGTGLTTLGGDLTVTGTAWTTTPTISGLITATSGLTSNGTVTIQNNSNFIQSGSGTFSTGTGAVSLNGPTTISGQTIFTKVPTLAHAFDPSWPSDVSNISNSSLYINPSSSIADGNLLGVAVGGVAKFIVDAEGDVYAKNLILTGSTTASSTTIGTLNVEGNTTLGDAGTDIVTIHGATSLDNTFSQTGANTFSTGTGTISLNGNTIITGNNTFQVGTNGVSMTILSGGNTGIGTTNPRTKLELGGDGSLLATGSYGSGWTEPNLGSGTRMFWYPSKASFRAGSVDSTQWNDSNIGSYSTATNKNTTASGTNSNATNDNTTASSYDSTAIGRWNVGGGTATSWVSTDPLFEVGNGGDSSTKANALTVYKNGNMQVQGSLTSVGINSGSGLIEGTGGLTITGTISLPNSSITNLNLANSTISGISLGSNLATLTFGTHLTGTSYNGSTGITIATDATDANTASTLVARDATGNFSAGTITATLTGHSSLDLPLTGGTMTGAITGATSINGLTITNNGTNTLNIATGKSLIVNNSLTMTGTDTTTMTFPTTSATIARTDSAQTFTGTQTFSSTISGSINGNANTVTNGVYTNAANSMTNAAPLTTLAESWIGPSSTAGIYFKGGNVGVGTTEPGSKLDIQGSGTNAFPLTIRAGTSLGTAGQSVGLKFYESTGTAPLGAVSSVAQDSTNVALAFSSYNGTDLLTERMRILGNGNVGIGTTGPATSLEISKSQAGQTSLLTLHNPNAAGNDTADINFSLSSGSTVSGRIGAIRTNRAVSGDTDLTFSTISNSVLGEKMRIRDDGNVGIGTTSPGALLTLGGDGTSSKGINFGYTNANWYGTAVGQIKTDGNITALGSLSLGGSITASGTVGIADGKSFYSTNNTQSFFGFGKTWGGITAAAGQVTIANQVGDMNFGNWSATNGFGFWNNAISGTSTKLMTILGNGNVGIGTTNPSELLHIESAAAGGAASPLSVLKIVRNFGGTTRAATGDIVGAIDFGAEWSSYAEHSALIKAIVDGNGTYNYPGTSLTFWTAGENTIATQKMVITNGGNVGIGTTTPSAPLTVQAVDTGAEAIRILGRVSGDYGTIIFRNNADNTFLGKIQASSALGGLTFGGGDTGDMIIKNGNVGIGTTSPGFKLEVNTGTVSGGIKINADTGYNSQILFHENNVLKGAFSYVASDDTVRIYNEGDRVIIKNDGNVGIGTTGPGATLHVVNSSVTTDAIIAQQAGTGNRITALANTDAWVSLFHGADNPALVWETGNMRFGTATDHNSTFTGYSEKMVILNNGNVGIGTTSPTQKLDIFSGSNVSTVGMRIGAWAHNSYYTDIISDASVQGDTLFNNVGGNATLQNMYFQFGGATKVTMQGTGNVGIGTTAPFGKLSNYNANILDATGNGVTGVSDIVWSTSGSGYITALENRDATATGRNGLLVKTAATDAASYIAKFESGGTNRVTIRSDGNVGIGTTNPQYLLHVYHPTSNVPIRAEAGGTNAWAALQLVPNGTGDSYISYGTPGGGNDLYFQTYKDNSTVVTIKDTGNVGIGTTGPAQLLEVSSAVNSPKIQISDRRGVSWWLGNEGYVNFSGVINPGSNNTFQDKYQIGMYPAGATDTSFVIRDMKNNADRLTILQTGNVGIGTTGPLNTLQLGDVFGLFQDANSGYIQVNRGAGNYIKSQYAAQIHLDSATGNIIFKTAPSGTAGNPITLTSVMTILNNGNVGIGTTGPVAKLDVNGTARIYNSALYFNSSVAGGEGSYYGRILSDYGTGLSGTAASIDFLRSSTSWGDNGAIVFQTNPGGGSLTERMRIASTGNVGIGTTNPQYRLQVGETSNYGYVTATGTWANASDARFKENVTTIVGSEALAMVRELRGIKYNTIGDSTNQIGFIAQEMKEVIPEIVSSDSNGYLGISYASLTPVLAAAIKELNLKLENINTFEKDAEGKKIVNIFRESITVWFANASNMIGDFYANRVRTKEICVSNDSGETCITRDALDNLMASAGGSGGGGGEDATAPVIALVGSTLINIDIKGVYADPGATATDDVDGDIKANIIVGGDTVNTAVSAIYTITYNVSDAAGNNAVEVTRKINVGEYVAPIATLESISITTPANKLSYLVDDALDISGLVVTGTYNDTTTKVETITVDNITGFDSAVIVASQILTITTGGKTATYNIEVK